MCSNRLRCIRRSRKLSQEEISEFLPVSQSMFSKIEHGRKILSIEDMSIVKKIARGLKVCLSS